MKSTKSLGAVAITLGAATLLALLPGAQASAHSDIVSSTPADGEVLTALPDAWEVVANDTLLYVGNDAAFGLWARDADGRYYGDGCVEVNGSGMSAAPVIGEAGDYTLVYSLISADGHPLSGEIPFEWAPTGETEVASGTAEPARCGTEAPEAETDPNAAPISADIWWIAAAIGAVGVAVIVTALVARRRSRPESREDSAT